MSTDVPQLAQLRCQAPQHPKIHVRVIRLSKFLGPEFSSKPLSSCSSSGETKSCAAAHKYARVAFHLFAHDRTPGQNEELRQEPNRSLLNNASGRDIHAIVRAFHTKRKPVLLLFPGALRHPRRRGFRPLSVTLFRFRKEYR